VPDRIAVMHQGFVPRYRLALFEMLNAGAAEYVVVHGEPPPGLGHYAAPQPFNFPNIRVESRVITLHGRSAIWQPIVGRLKEFDAIVVGTHLQFVSNHVAFALSKARRRAVLLWGHGLEHTGDMGTGSQRVARVTSAVKRCTAHVADGYLAYTAGGAAHVIASGMDPSRVFVVRNSIDMQEQSRLHSALVTADVRALRESFGLESDSIVFAYIGRVYPEKLAERLVVAARELAEPAEGRPRVEVVFVGDGRGLPAVRGRANGLRNVHFLGEVQSQQRVAELLRLTHAVVIPGAVGLAINHAFGHGVPFVTQPGRDHGPEIEYLEPGRNGILVDGGTDGLVAALRDLAERPGWRDELAAGSLATRDRLTLDVTVRQFQRGVEETLTRVRASGRRR
jgi:glycosyltransferase involved in cell wall biosynthesis